MIMRLWYSEPTKEKNKNAKAAYARYTFEPYLGDKNFADFIPTEKNAINDEYPKRNMNIGHIISTCGKYFARDIATTASS